LVNLILFSVNEGSFFKPPKQPAEDYELFEGFWIQRGNLTPVTPSHYILTNSIKKNLNNLARIVIARKYPVLLQVGMLSDRLFTLSIGSNVKWKNKHG
jgi:midasin (ATPase involved in ribosome maturation)